METDLRRITLWGIVSAMIVYIIGWFINIMEVDAAQYAAITLEMLKNGEYLTFTDHGEDYLDKPPLIFWMSGISMSIFGANNVAYRIPAFLATILALYATYRYAKIYYSNETAMLSALILATLQATFMINHDVRTDTNLMAFYIFSLWQLAAFLEEKKWKNFILGFIGIGVAMLAKGPIGLIAPALGIFGHLICKKKWSDLFSAKWILGLVIVAVVLAPMSYGLYTQFDLHPEKLVNGKTGTSGLRFFYWTQSFGRITGESKWDNNMSPFFLSHSTLWAFAPWSLFLVLGLADRLKNLFLYLQGKAQCKEFITLFGLILPFAALSASRYQLPHYAFVVYPLGAIVTADYMLRTFYHAKSRWTNGLYIFQTTLLYVTLGLVFWLVWFPFPYENKFALAFFILIVASLSWVVFRAKTNHKLILSCTVFIIGINLILNSYFYPNILEYQAGSELGLAAKNAGVQEGKFYSYQAGEPHSLNFYSTVFVEETGDFDGLISQRNCFVFTDSELLDEFKAARPDLKVIDNSGDYSVTRLKGKFLNPSTRAETLRKRILIKL